MKTTVLAFILTLFFFSASGQYVKETLIGGRINYVGGGRVVAGDKTVNKGFTLKIAPSIHYFIRNEISIGTGLGYEYVTDDYGRQHTVELSPNLRYYHWLTTHFYLFLHAEHALGWGSSKLENGERSRHFVQTSSLKPGVFIRFSDRVSSELTFSSLQYKHVRIKDRDSGEKITDSEWDFTWLDLSFGVSFFIGL